MRPEGVKQSKKNKVEKQKNSVNTQIRSQIL
jgi:hypothetical protein